MTKPEHAPAVPVDWRALFDERHGEGAYQRLLTDLRQPCVTFAAIARRLGVSRERVRQWQIALLPDAPRGHERQQLCAALQRKRQLLQDPVFRAFYRHARARVDSARIELVSAADGYRRRVARIDQRVIVLRSARPCGDARRSTAPEYRLAAYSGVADLVYYRLVDDDYLLMPAQHLLTGEVRFVDAAGARYFECKNTFAALDVADGRGPAGERSC